MSTWEYGGRPAGTSTRAAAGSPAAQAPGRGAVYFGMEAASLWMVYKTARQLSAARERGLSLSLPGESEERPGAGMSGVVDGHRLKLGSYAWVGGSRPPTPWARAVITLWVLVTVPLMALMLFALGAAVLFWFLARHAPQEPLPREGNITIFLPPHGPERGFDLYGQIMWCRPNRRGGSPRRRRSPTRTLATTRSSGARTTRRSTTGTRRRRRSR